MGCKEFCGVKGSRCNKPGRALRGNQWCCRVHSTSLCIDFVPWALSCSLNPASCCSTPNITGMVSGASWQGLNGKLLHNCYSSVSVHLGTRCDWGVHGWQVHACHLAASTAAWPPTAAGNVVPSPFLHEVGLSRLSTWSPTSQSLEAPAVALN